jgi:hypothetical protein
MSQLQARNRFLIALIAGLIASAAHGVVTFSYGSDFNNEGEFAIPQGWTTTAEVLNFLPPVVLFKDPNNWLVEALPPGGIQDYDVGWSGGTRFSLIHPAETTTAGLNRTVSAWYSGQGEQNYPMDLRVNSLKAEFDLSLRTGIGCQDPNTGEIFPGDGVTFAVQPVTNLSSDAEAIGEGFGGLAWGGLEGFAIEFDLFADAGRDPAGADAGNHAGLDVRVTWDGGSIESVVTHLDPPASLPELTLPRFVDVGNNNQPLHVTVYYNDPNEGGHGVVRVYLKVDSATKDPGEPNAPISYGMQPSDPPQGVLILEACVGEWPTAEAIFGFTATNGGCDAVIQVDNVFAETDDEGGSLGPACIPTIAPESGSLVTLSPAAKVAECSDPTLTSPGWDVRTYLPAAFGIDNLKSSIAAAEFFGSGGITSVTGEPDLNYNDGGCAGDLTSSRLYPGIPSDSDDFGLQATGWICFPMAGDYVLDFRSDDGFELVIGSDATEQLVMIYDSGRDCSTISRATLSVSAAGVYPIRLLHFEGGGGAGLEFTWVETPLSPLLSFTRWAIGTTLGIPDEPLVYGQWNGQRAPTGDFAVPPIPIPLSGLLPGTGTGPSGFEIKSVYAPTGNSIIESRDDDGNTTARRFLALLQDESAGAIASSVNFRDRNDDLSPQPDGDIPGGVEFPGVTGDNFAVRARGFATFPAAGTYQIWVDWDDHARVTIGGRPIVAATSGGSKLIPIEIPAAGVYPVQVEQVEFIFDARVELGEVVDGVGLVAINDTGSTISVNTQVTSGAYDWPEYVQDIPGDRRVANPGAGDTLGWSATLGKAVDIGAGSPPVIDKRGYGTMLIENDQFNLPLGSFPQGFDLPLSVNYADVGESSADERFGGNRPLTVFGSVVDPNGGNDSLAVSVEGYIEFPAAGLYGLNFNADDGAMLWVGGEILTMYPFGSPPRDTTPAIISIAAAGLYDIRVDYFENGGGLSFELFQYLPDGSVAEINSALATVSVYRTLNTAPLTTAYSNPVAVPASAKAAPLGAGGTPGMRVQVVNRTFLGGDGNNAFGGDPFRHVDYMSELLDVVLDGATSLTQSGTLVADVIETAISYLVLEDFPGPPSEDDFALRVTGLLELSAGGHLFEIDSDNGFNMWVGGTNPKVDGWHVGRSGSLKGPIGIPCYLSVAEDGLYRFTIEYFERGGGENLILNELIFLDGFLTSVQVNVDPEASVAYADLKPCNDPAADVDGDSDVDIVDLATLQRCADTGISGAAPYCLCLDLDADGDVDAADYVLAEPCVDGPDVASNCGL